MLPARRVPGTPLDVPEHPRTHALASTTFTPPPLDGSLTVPEFYDWHHTHSPLHPLFIYSDNGTLSTLSWQDAARAVHRAARIVLGHAGDRPSSYSKPPVFAILASNESITYFTLMAGICRSGMTAFPISPRNSPAAIAHLLAKTEASHIFVGPESALQNLAASALGHLDASGTTLPASCHVPTFAELYPNTPEDNFELLPPLNVSWDDPTIIVHSSGSTAFPKPIVWTHERYFLLARHPWYGERDLTGQRLASHSMPMFHGLGMIMPGWTGSVGLVLSVFKPQIPPQVPTPESVMQGAIDTASDLIFCVPSFVESWASNPEHVEHLCGIQGIIYGGGPLSQGVGDELVAKGVSIFSMYGISETGVNNVILPNTTGTDWQYFSFSEDVHPYFKPNGEGNYELIVVSSATEKPCVINTQVDGIDAYATSDLLTPHPTKPGLWTIYGRSDDQIMHSTGEKTNPGPLENILNRDPHVQSAVMFGRGRFNAGVIVDPRPEFKFDPEDAEKLAEFRNLIWPSIQRLNDYAPQHSRIFKEMVMVSLPHKPFTYTAKNTARRQAIIHDYQVEIDTLYTMVEESAQTELTPPAVWDLDNTTTFIRTVVNKILKSPVTDDEDIFQRGCDSLQATWIRNSVLHALRASANVDTRRIPVNFVYQYPSVSALTPFVMGYARARCSVGDQSQDLKIAEMLRLVEAFTQDFPAHQPSVRDTEAGLPEGDVVLVTGTTGGLGCGLLAQMVACPEIARVYALNRKGETPLRDRQEAALLAREFDVGLLDSPKIVLLECESDQEELGLPSGVYEELRASITHVVHNAWPVNFNLSLLSFESQLKTIRNLVDLALSSHRPAPPRFLFVSSIGVVAGATSEPVKEEEVPASAAVNTGYTEAKWVAEKILSVASAQTALRPVIVRLGQVCGSSTGAWNVAEWFPSLVRSSVFLKSLPTTDSAVSLLPADTAARALLEMRDADAPFLNLMHPEPVPWPTLATPLAETFGFQTVPFPEWVALLAQSGRGHSAEDEVVLARKNPALKLLDYFVQGTTIEGTPFLGMCAMDMSEALRVSAALRDVQPIDKEDVLRWVAYWQRCGFL